MATLKKVGIPTLRKLGYIAAALMALFGLGGYLFGCFEDVYILVTNTKNIPTYGERLTKLESKAERDSIAKYWRDKREHRQDSIIQTLQR